MRRLGVAREGDVLKKSVASLATLLLALSLLASAAACGDGGDGADSPSASSTSPSPSVASVESEAQTLEEYVTALEAAFAPVGEMRAPYLKAVAPAQEAVERSDAAAFEKARTPAAKAVADLRDAFRQARRGLQSIEPPPGLRAVHEREQESLRIWEHELEELRTAIVSLGMADVKKRAEATSPESRRADRGILKWWVALVEEADRLDVELPESLVRGASPY